MTSRAVTVAEALKDEVATVLDGVADVRRIWVPAFEVKEITSQPVVAVRVAGRSTEKSGKPLSTHSCNIEIGILRKIPAPATADADPNNNLDALDEVDELAELVFDLFTVSDESPQPNRGLLATKRIENHLLTDVSQPTAVDPQHLRERREFVTVILVTYTLME